MSDTALHVVHDDAEQFALAYAEGCAEFPAIVHGDQFTVGTDQLSCTIQKKTVHHYEVVVYWRETLEVGRVIARANESLDRLYAIRLQNSKEVTA